MSKRKSQKPMCVKLQIKVGRSYVYLDKDDTMLRRGPTGRAMRPVDFALSIESKAERRSFRKSLFQIDRNLAALTVPAKPLSKRRVEKILRDAAYQVRVDREYDDREQTDWDHLDRVSYESEKIAKFRSNY